MIVLVILLTILSFGLLLWQVSNLVSVFYGSPYVVMDKNVIRQALKLAGLKKGEIFYDLGCGNGQSLVEAAKLGAHAEGFEVSPYYYIYSTIRILLYYEIRSSVKSVKIKVRFSNIYQADLSKADVVYCYLLPKMLEKLAPKFKKELKKDSRLISMGFPIKALKNGTEYHINSRKVFIYIIL